MLHSHNSHFRRTSLIMCARARMRARVSCGNTEKTGNRLSNSLLLLAFVVLTSIPTRCLAWEWGDSKHGATQARSALRLVFAPDERGEVVRPASQALFQCATTMHAQALCRWCWKAVSATSAVKQLDLGKCPPHGGLRGSSRQGPSLAGALGDSVQFLWVKLGDCAVRIACAISSCVESTEVRHGC